MVLTKSRSDLNSEFSAPDFDLPGVDGQNYTLQSFAAAKVLVVIFMCNHCPYVLAVLARLNCLGAEFQAQGVQFVGINANDPKAYPADSFAEMQKLAIQFPYLHDETQAIAKSYQAVCTPDIFVFGPDRKLKYHGRIDDNWQDEKAVKKRELKKALQNILQGREVAAWRPSMGCSIKWKTKGS